MTWLGKFFQVTPYTDYLSATASVYDSCGHPSIDEVMRGYTDVLDNDISATVISSINSERRRPQADTTEGLQDQSQEKSNQRTDQRC